MIPLRTTHVSQPAPAKLRIEPISDPISQRSDLRCAIAINNDRLPAAERYDESIFVNLIQRHLSGDFGPHRSAAHWKGHFLVARYAAEVVGMLLGYDDLKANYSFISYLSAKPIRLDVSNEEEVGRGLLEEFFRIQQKARTTDSLRLLTEVDDPTRTEDRQEQQRRLARLGLFDRIATYAGMELRSLDLAYLQPKLDPWSSKAPESKLLLLYAARRVPPSFEKTEALDILTWTYTQLYAANMFDQQADFERYMRYIRDLLNRISGTLPDRVDLLKVQKLRSLLLGMSPVSD